jgi:putative phosphoribosyl transferase
MSIDVNSNNYFVDREDASLQLINVLPVELLSKNETVVIAVSEGGVYFADKISRFCNAQMDLLLTEAILAPNNPEIAIAMISETEEVVMHKALIDAFEINEDYIYSEAHRKYEEDVLSYVYKYRKGKDLVSLSGKYVVLADECIETGLTMMVALKSVIERGAKNIYIATPILDKAVYENLLAICDGVFCPHNIRDYISIEYYYQNFEKLNFDEISIIVNAQEEKNKTENTIKLNEEKNKI